MASSAFSATSSMWLILGTDCHLLFRSPFWKESNFCSEENKAGHVNKLADLDWSYLMLFLKANKGSPRIVNDGVTVATDVKRDVSAGNNNQVGNMIGRKGGCGGGCTLLRLSSKVDAIKETLANDEEKVGADIVKKELSYPLKLIAGC